MTTERRELRGDVWTTRQHRQYMRMARRQHDREMGDLPPHGATGEKIRRPLVFTSKPPERGSIRTHIAAYCAPCDLHWRRPRLHRYGLSARAQVAVPG